jgi:IclR family pca regulon transcriptional regulator
MGRVMLAGLDRAAQQAYLRRTELTARTDRTVTEPLALLEILDHVAQEGYAIMDQELERGLRSVAVPVIVDGRVIAAVNIGTQADRVSMADLHSRYLPALRRVARDLAALRPV